MEDNIVFFAWKHKDGYLIHSIPRQSFKSEIYFTLLWRVRWICTFTAIENRIYIRGEFTRKECITAILLYCFHTTGVLHIFMLCNLLGPGISFYRKSKINVKRNPNYEIGWFHNWPMVISHRHYAFHFTNDDFPLQL